jgi:hypothetical protein
MNTARIVFLVFLIIAFITGGYVYSFVDMKKQIERMGGITDQSKHGEQSGNTVAGNASAESASCPDLLIQQGKLIYLYNTKRPEKVGENPILFNNLDEYITYRDLSGGSCPILYLQSAYNTQGKKVYNVTNINPALPLPGTTIGSLPLTTSVSQPPGPVTVEEVKDASRDNGYNQNMYAGFDPHNLDIGKYTTVDKIHDSTKTADGVTSENPMDPNWGGIGVTESAVDSGKYDENLVVPQTYTTPKGGQFLPIPNSNIPKYPSNGVIPTISERTGRVVGGTV